MRRPDCSFRKAVLRRSVRTPVQRAFPNWQTCRKDTGHNRRTLSFTRLLLDDLTSTVVFRTGYTQVEGFDVPAVG